METDSSGYHCVDYLDEVVISFSAATEQLNHIAVGASPANTDRAAAIAATAALSLNAKYVKLPAGSPAMTSAFRSLHNEIQQNMDRIFVRGGSDIGNTNEAVIVYSLNDAKDMVLVIIAPLSEGH
jgi:hypothetical protein